MAVRSKRSGIYGRIVRIDTVFTYRPLCYPELVSFYADRADGGTFAAQQAFVADFLDSGFVVAPELAVKVYRCVLYVRFLDAHRAGVYAQSATWT